MVDLTYDDPSGFYLGGSLVGAASDDRNPGLLGVIAQAGYARRISPDLSLDLGMSRLDFRPLRSSGRRLAYSEYYLGAGLQWLSAHIYYSPEYGYPDAPTIYGELEAHRETFARVRLSAHVGVLKPLTAPRATRSTRSAQYDWRIGAARGFGPIDLSAALSGVSPGSKGRAYDGYVPAGGTTVVFGAGWTF